MSATTRQESGTTAPEPLPVLPNASTAPANRSSRREIAADRLEQELESLLDGELRFDPGSRALYATDASNYRQVPIGVVIPRNVEDVVATVGAARRYGAPLLARGGGTSIAGQCCNVAVLMDFSKYLNGVLEIDPERRLARVQAGCVLDTLRKAAREHDLTFGPDPATHRWCTLGGMVGNNSCGVHSVMARMAGLGSRTSDNIHEMEILTYDGVRMRVGPTSEEELERIIREGGRKGEIYGRLKALRDRYADLIRERFPKLPRRVSGYNLDELLPENGFNVARALTGTESTCVVVLEVTTHLIPLPRERVLLLLGYPDVYQAADHVTEVLEFQPTGLEGIDGKFIEDLRKKDLNRKEICLFPEGNGWLLAEFGGNTVEEARERACRLMEKLRDREDAPSVKLFDDPEQQEMIWDVRENGLGATSHVPGERENWEGWEDSAVPPERVGHYLRDLHKLLERYDYHTSVYGHFGDGCIHARIDFDLKTAEGIRKWRSFLDEASDLVIGYGGSLSGEHGDGQARGELLPKLFGEELMEAFREFKAIWDPEGKMNPGKVINADPITTNLRYGAAYLQPELKTHFQFPSDHFSFGYAMERCVGVGKCRKEDVGTMCPSYMATREEMHTTRGRARLLFEMLQGDPLEHGWQSEHVKESLELCLSCKGCKQECPVQVDMATYKAEFLAHYFEGKRRPRQAYIFGFIHWWARLASLLPGMANFVAHAPGLRDLMKRAGGIAPDRELPAFAPQTFKQWFQKRAGARNQASARGRDSRRGPVILWPDTFNNHFHPEIAQAAVEVLEAAGFEVRVPQRDFCCGRPLYDWGFLDTAKQWLRQILTELQPEIQAGVPVVCLEPSCMSVFREELTNLFPNHEDAMRLQRQTFLLGEFLRERAPDFELPDLTRQAVVHGHCHHKATAGLDADRELFEAMGLDFQVLNSGCCGMAGAFGFEPGDKYEVSMQCGERVLLPAVREAPKDALIITDGFSCHEQIRQTTDREALHLAQVLRMALRQDEPVPRDYPESAFDRLEEDAADKAAATLRTAAIVGTGAVLGAGLVWALQRRRK